MIRRFSIILIGTIFISTAMTLPLKAEDKIQAFVSPTGKVVFTNLVDNTPPPVKPVLPGRSDVLEGEMPSLLKALVENVSNTHGVDPALVRAVMKTESNFNRWAVSRKGALGLMQLIPETGRRYGVQDFFDPQQNVEGGVRYLKFLLNKFHDNLDLSLAAYNAGENLVERLGRIPPIPETTNYVRKVRANYRRSGTETELTASMRQFAAKTAVNSVSVPEHPAEPVKEETHQIFRTVGPNGVVHFSNVEPAN